MSEQLDHIMGNCNHLTRKTQETILTQRNGSSLFAPIDEWEKVNIDRISRAAEYARQQIVDQMRRKKVDIMKGVESINLEIRTRQGAGDFIEDDLERLRRNISRLQQDLDQFIQRPVPLRLRKLDQSEWNNLIYVDQQSGDNISRTLERPLTG